MTKRDHTEDRPTPSGGREASGRSPRLAELRAGHRRPPRHAAERERSARAPRQVQGSATLGSATTPPPPAAKSSTAPAPLGESGEKDTCFGPVAADGPSASVGLLAAPGDASCAVVRCAWLLTQLCCDYAIRKSNSSDVALRNAAAWVRPGGGSRGSLYDVDTGDRPRPDRRSIRRNFPGIWRNQNRSFSGAAVCRGPDCGGLDAMR